MVMQTRITSEFKHEKENGFLAAWLASVDMNSASWGIFFGEDAPEMLRMSERSLE